MHHRGVNHHVVVDEFRRPRRVGHDAADGAGDEIDVLGPVGPEPVVDRGLIAEIELIARGGQDVLEAELFEPPDDGGANQAAMAGDENPGSANPSRTRSGFERSKILAGLSRFSIVLRITG